MGQTLSHGVYLPNEGERNCYAGLASNWQILNTAVGAIAEKAPLVHTHTVSQITDFPAYGNAAGTICEGNDSRLSDARTPVAHTHTKSDITDLLNSNFIPSANNSYDLGSSSYQWKKIYAKNYYYNGTPWGLDKANEWTGDNTFSNTLTVQTGYALGTLPQAESAVALFTGRTTDNNFATNINFYQNPTRGTGLRFTIRNKWGNNGYSTTGTTRNAHFELLQSINKTAYMQWEGYVNNGLYPLANNTYDLGSSSYKWKTINGINPGALSLPDISKYDNVTSQVQPPAGESTINLQGGANTWTASADGYLIYMGRYNHFSQVYLYVADTYIGAQMSTDANSAPLYRFVSVPVCKNQVVQIQVYGTQFNSVYFYQNLGNV